LRHYYGACGWGTARFDAAIQCVQYGPGLGDVIAAGDSDGRIHFICAQTGEKILCPVNVDESVSSIDFAPCGNKLAAAFNIYQYGSFKEGGVKIFSNQGSAGFVCQSTLSGHSHWVLSVAWSPDGTKLASGSRDQTVRIWEAATGKQLSQLTGHSNWVTLVSWSPDGKRLASGSWDKTVRIWEVATGKELWQLNVDAGGYGVQSVAFSPKGDMVAAGCSNGNIFFVDAAAGQIKSSLRCDSQVMSVAYSPDGTKLAAGLNQNSMVVFDTQTNEQICSLKAHSFGVRAVAWSPCGRWLASGGDDKMVCVYDAKTFEVKWPLRGE